MTVAFDIADTPSVQIVCACATGADSIATAPTVAAIATNLIFVIFIIHTPSISLA
jgi:3-oxoacyl-(acyl-carrier-protein) synthase